MVYPTDDSIDKVNNLSKEEALRQYDELFKSEAANIIRAYHHHEKLLFLLKSAGYSQSAAITKMSNDAHRLGLKGFSEASIRYALPAEVKKKTIPGPRQKSNSSVTFLNARLVAEDEKPNLPPRDEVTIEAESEPEKVHPYEPIEPHLTDPPTIASAFIPPPIRLIMLPSFFKTLCDLLNRYWNENGEKTNYAFEYNPHTQELYVDIAEEDEWVNIK